MMFQHMNKNSACFFVLMIVSPLYAQDRQPIIDMHLHAYPVGHFWPPGATYNCCPEFRAAHANSLLIEKALARHPDLRVYIMHAGYPFIDETIALLHAHPQVYADLAVINWVIPRDEFHFYLKRLVQAGFHDRLMFGSDQMFWPETIETGIENIKTTEFLTGDQKRDIFYNNAAWFLRLSEEVIARHHDH